MNKKLELEPVYRMSSSGYCPRRLAAMRLNLSCKEDPPWLTTSAREGSKHEEWIVEQLREAGHIVSDQQLELSLATDLFKFTGHIDGTITLKALILSLEIFPEAQRLLENYNYLNIRMLLEIKTMSQFEFDRWMKGQFDEFPQYEAQIRSYSHMTGLHFIFYIVKNRSTGTMKYYLLSTFDIRPTFKEILDKFWIVESKAQQNDLPETIYNEFSMECRRCSYADDLCIKELVLTEVEEKHLQNAANKYRESHKVLKQAEFDEKKARSIFKQHSEASNVHKWQFDDLKISLTESSRTGYDKERLLELLTKDQLKTAITINSYPVLRITDTRKEED